MMDGSKDGWMDGQMDGWTDRGMDRVSCGSTKHAGENENKNQRRKTEFDFMRAIHQRDKDISQPTYE